MTRPWAARRPVGPPGRGPRPAARAGPPLGALTTYRVGGRRGPVRGGRRRGRTCSPWPGASEAAGRRSWWSGRGRTCWWPTRGFAGLAVALGRAVRPGLEIGRRATVRAGRGPEPPGAGPADRRRPGLRGLEWAVGVPGSVGGAVRMNAGGHGSDMAASLVACRWSTWPRGRRRVAGRAGSSLGYRRSAVAATEVVVVGRVRPRRRATAAEASAAIADIVRWRRASTSPAGPTPGRCSPTRPATRPGG